MGCFGFDVFMFDSNYSKKSKLIETGKKIVEEKQRKLDEGHYSSFLHEKSLDYSDWSHINLANEVFVDSDSDVKTDPDLSQSNLSSITSRPS